MKGSIYHIFNTINGKCYIGQTWRAVEVRWRQHCAKNRQCIKLANAIQKHGKEAFVVSVLTKDLTTQENMDRAEIYWIKYFNSVDAGYNLKEGGGRGALSAETRSKLSAAGRRRAPPTMRTRQKIRDARKNQVFSKETRIKFCNRRHSAETREKLRQAWILRKLAHPPHGDCRKS